ncbi:MAG: hypothetical protein ACOYOJ_10850, partial [Alsobacter sp.]
MVDVATNDPASPVPGARKAWRMPSLMRTLRLPEDDPLAIIGVTIYVVFLLVALFADALAKDPFEILFSEDGNLAANLPPSLAYPLGTTNLGRDIFSQLVIGTR